MLRLARMDIEFNTKAIEGRMADLLSERALPPIHIIILISCSERYIVLFSRILPIRTKAYCDTLWATHSYSSSAVGLVDDRFPYPNVSKELGKAGG